MPRYFLLTLFVLFMTVRSASAQPEPDPADVESIEAIIDAVYEVISGPATEERDWDRFRSLFHESGRLIPLAIQGDAVQPLVWSVEDYVERATPMFRDAPIFQGKGFYEVAAFNVIEVYDRIAHVWSTYESRLDPSEEPFARGINSFQLYKNAADHWQVLAIFWEQESPAAPIPADYLPD